MPVTVHGRYGATSGAAQGERGSLGVLVRNLSGTSCRHAMSQLPANMTEMMKRTRVVPSASRSRPKSVDLSLSDKALEV